MNDMRLTCKCAIVIIAWARFVFGARHIANRRSRYDDYQVGSAESTSFVENLSEEDRRGYWALETEHQRIDADNFDQEFSPPPPRLKPRYRTGRRRKRKRKRNRTNNAYRGNPSRSKPGRRKRIKYGDDEYDDDAIIQPHYRKQPGYHFLQEKSNFSTNASPFPEKYPDFLPDDLASNQQKLSARKNFPSKYSSVLSNNDSVALISPNSTFFENDPSIIQRDYTISRGNSTLPTPSPTFLGADPSFSSQDSTACCGDSAEIPPMPSFPQKPFPRRNEIILINPAFRKDDLSSVQRDMIIPKHSASVPQNYSSPENDYSSSTRRNSSLRDANVISEINSIFEDQHPSSLKNYSTVGCDSILKNATRFDNLTRECPGNSTKRRNETLSSGNTFQFKSQMENLIEMGNANGFDDKIFVEDNKLPMKENEINTNLNSRRENFNFTNATVRKIFDKEILKFRSWRSTSKRIDFKTYYPSLNILPVAQPTSQVTNDNITTETVYFDESYLKSSRQINTSTDQNRNLISNNIELPPNRNQNALNKIREIFYDGSSNSWYDLAKNINNLLDSAASVENSSGNVFEFSNNSKTILNNTRANLSDVTVTEKVYSENSKTLPTEQLLPLKPAPEYFAGKFEHTSENVQKDVEKPTDDFPPSQNLGYHDETREPLKKFQEIREHSINFTGKMNGPSKYFNEKIRESVGNEFSPKLNIGRINESPTDFRGKIHEPSINSRAKIHKPPRNLSEEIGNPPKNIREEIRKPVKYIGDDANKLPKNFRGKTKFAHTSQGTKYIDKNDVLIIRNYNRVVPIGNLDETKQLRLIAINNKNNGGEMSSRNSEGNRFKNRSDGNNESLSSNNNDSFSSNKLFVSASVAKAGMKAFSQSEMKYSGLRENELIPESDENLRENLAMFRTDESKYFDDDPNKYNGNRGKSAEDSGKEGKSNWFNMKQFFCRGMRGYLADRSTDCKVFYICDGNGAALPMICPKGTLFSQELRVCDWWYNVRC